MATGTQRLADKHAAKNKKLAEASEKMLAEIENGTQQKAKIVKINARTDIEELTPEEKKKFDKIFAKVSSLHDDPDKYTLAIINLVKLYSLNKRLYEIMENDGGPIATNPAGKLYAHPAAKMIQQNRAQILDHLKNLALVAPKSSKAKADLLDSEFAQFM